MGEVASFQAAPGALADARERRAVPGHRDRARGEASAQATSPSAPPRPGAPGGTLWIALARRPVHPGAARRRDRVVVAADDRDALIAKLGSGGEREVAAATMVARYSYPHYPRWPRRFRRASTWRGASLPGASPRPCSDAPRAGRGRRRASRSASRPQAARGLRCGRGGAPRSRRPARRRRRST